MTQIMLAGIICPCNIQALFNAVVHNALTRAMVLSTRACGLMPRIIYTITARPWAWYRLYAAVLQTIPRPSNGNKKQEIMICLFYHLFPSANTNSSASGLGRRLMITKPAIWMGFPPNLELRRKARPPVFQQSVNNCRLLRWLKPRLAQFFGDCSPRHAAVGLPAVTC